MHEDIAASSSRAEKYAKKYKNDATALIFRLFGPYV
jgi:hypothetical protein